MLSLLPPRWRRYLRWTIVLLVLIMFTTQPEVRLMVSLLDAIGLDVILMLFGAQLLSTYADVLVPMLQSLRYGVLAPTLQWLSSGSRRWPLCRTLRARISRQLRRAAIGRQAWLRIHALWWALVRRAPPKPRTRVDTPMIAPSNMRPICAIDLRSQSIGPRSWS